MNYSIAIDKTYTMYIHSLKKLLFVNKIMQKDNSNIAMRILWLEFTASISTVIVSFFLPFYHC